MNLKHRLDSDLSSESSTADTDRKRPEIYTGFLPFRNQYYSDSDSGIVAPSQPFARRECDSQVKVTGKMSPKDRASMLEAQERDDFARDWCPSTQENDFWTYDDQSALSEESVRRSCHQIYTALQQSSGQKVQPYSPPGVSDFNHQQGYRTNGRDYFPERTNSLKSPKHVTTPGSTLSRRAEGSLPKVLISSFGSNEPEDIVRVYARPASVVPVPDVRTNGDNCYDTLSRRGPDPYQFRRGNTSVLEPSEGTYSRSSADSSRVSLVSMDQNHWRETQDHYSQQYYHTPMFKSQPCLTTSGCSSYSETFPYSTINGKVPVSPSHCSSDQAISPSAVKGRRAEGLEAFGTLNERNRVTINRADSDQRPTDSSCEGQRQRPSREPRCRRSKSFADKLHRGSQSFRSACSAFRRAFSQERIYRPEKQERDQRDFINSNKNNTNPKEERVVEKEMKREPSPLLSSGRLIVNGIREKLGGGKEIFANCNTYSSKLAVHRRKPKRSYQPPQLVSTHATSPERALDGFDSVDSQPTSFGQDECYSSSEGWIPNSTNTNDRVWGHLIQLNVDGSQVIELSRPRGFHFGFFVARGRVKDNRGVFVSRMRDVLTQKNLSGILEVGDEILEIEGRDIRGADILTVNSMMANKQTLLLTVLPYISRKDI